MDPYILVTCPYNPAHRIQKYKFSTHLIKCKKTAKKIENKTVCPLDRNHIVDKDQLKEHIKTCPSLGKLLDLNVGDFKPNTDIDTHRSIENWGEEPEVASYNPMEMSENKPVMRCVSGLSKLEKKKFRDSERMRMANLMSGINFAKPTPLEKDTVQERPLRPPCSTSVTLHDEETVLSCMESTQNDFDISQMNDNLDADTQTGSKYSHEMQNLFYRTLYDELAPECNDINQQLEHSLYSTDMEAHGYCQNANQEKRNLPINQNHETKVKNTELNKTFEVFNVDNIKGKNECVGECTSKSSAERVKLLALLKNSDVKKIDSVEEIKKTSSNYENSGERTSKGDVLYSKLNDRLAYLTDIQNTAAEESAQLYKQLKELELSDEFSFKK